MLFAIGPTLMLALGATVVASAQSNSPFANKKKVNAWELPQAGVATQTDTQVETQAKTQTQSRTTTTSSTTQTQGLMLRSRTLSPETATAPPPGASKPTTTAARAQVVQSKTSPIQAAPVQEASVQTTPVQTVPTESYVYRSSGTSSPPLTSPPLTSPSVTPGLWQLAPGSSASRVTSNNPSSSNPGAYGNVPRGSVNSPPSRAVNNETDWTVHKLANPVRTYPGQQANAAPAGSSTGSWGQYESQSQKPTAYEYGYRRPGEPQPDAMANNGTPTDSQYGHYGTADPRTAGNRGPNSGQYPDPYAQAGPQSGPAPKQGFFNRIGLGALSTLIRGAIRGGAAARENNGWEEAFVADGDIELELSAFTQGGLEWGVHGQVRAQYDEGRKGFTRRLPDCPPTLAGCSTILVAGTPTSVRGHTSQFYTFGPDVGKDTQIALESAHLFLRSAYGDVTIGRDDGAAYLFSLGAPTLLNVGASNSSVDYTGLDAVKTLNDASGFSEKITYTSPRLLGDQVGVGVQFGVSYALDAEACGVDYCVDVDGIQNVVTPDLKDIMEAGIALDRTFAPGMSVEATATYARGSEQSGLTGLDDLQAFGTGLEFRMNDFTLGGSYLNSNQGLMNGDYEAYDVGLTWQPSVLGFTMGYGHANDANVGLSSDQITGGVTYDVNERIRLGAGVQYSDRDTVQDVAGTAQTVNEKATAIFIEAGITF
ncbi:hypothetical protein GCM10009069_07250 [Algimonas arctica]|uniref:Porin domain-containing protein n=1 Tax=Algimonas arctica TaxID=1479486 RepID=A0A8J3CMT9_9PROT|nr:hypothetical protein GCM10009069_07250 [Algimonas arctica]